MVVGALNRESRIGELKVASGQKFACCVPLFCIKRTSLTGAGAAGSAWSCRAKAAVAGMAASACKTRRRLNDKAGIGRLLARQGLGVSETRVTNIGVDTMLSKASVIRVSGENDAPRASSRPPPAGSMSPMAYR